MKRQLQSLISSTTQEKFYLSMINEINCSADLGTTKPDIRAAMLYMRDTLEVRVYGGRPHAYDRAFAELATKERDNVQRRPCVYLIEHVDAEGLAPTAEGMEAVLKASKMLMTLPY